MAGIFIYSDQTDIAREIIGFSRLNGRQSVVLTLGEEDAQALQNAGADKIMAIKGESEMIENYAQAIAVMLKDESAELFAVGATPRGRDLAARVAGYLDCAMVSDIAAAGFEGDQFFCTRMMYGGAVQQTEKLSGLSVITIPPGKFATAQGEASILSLELPADNRVSLMETAPIVKEGVDLSKAEKVVCVGMALDKAEDLQIARDLADVIGAELGCTRSIAEERHWLPVESYIGISGAVIKPKLYLSMGVSGQIQHVYGIRDAGLIVAIDTNEKAPIFKAADYGIVGDLYQVVPMLTEALKK